ncbi:MAG TPA: hypothetical protein VGD12_15475 [Blastococcus sp.]
MTPGPQPMSVSAQAIDGEGGAVEPVGGAVVVAEAPATQLVRPHGQRGVGRRGLGEWVAVRAALGQEPLAEQVLRRE